MMIRPRAPLVLFANSVLADIASNSRGMAATAVVCCLSLGSSWPASAQTTSQPSRDTPADLLNLSSGAVVLSQSSQYNDQWAALLLLDDSTKQGWAAAERSPFPHEVLIELAGPTRLTSIVFDNTNVQESGYPGISARAIEVWASVQGPAAGFAKVLEVEAKQGARSSFSFSEKPQARWLKLVIRSNWGHATFTELMELEAYGEPQAGSVRPAKLAGVYRTNYGLMLFEEDGTRVSGCYDWDDGTLTGSTDGRVTQFEWRENSGTQIGTALMVLAHSGDLLNGVWYEGGVYKGLWVGSRAGANEKPKCRPRTTGAIEQSLKESGRAIVYGIRFDVDSDRIRTDSESTLQEMLSVMQRQADIRLVVEGHTDSTGDDAHNLELSQKRARSVVKWLVEHGIEAKRLEAKGYGESQPSAGNDTSQGRALNRRVELKRQP